MLFQVCRCLRLLKKTRSDQFLPGTGGDSTLPGYIVPPDIKRLAPTLENLHLGLCSSPDGRMRLVREKMTDICSS